MSDRTPAKSGGSRLLLLCVRAFRTGLSRPIATGWVDCGAFDPAAVDRRLVNRQNAMVSAQAPAEVNSRLTRCRRSGHHFGQVGICQRDIPFDILRYMGEGNLRPRGPYGVPYAPIGYIDAPRSNEVAVNRSCGLGPGARQLGEEAGAGPRAKSEGPPCQVVTRERRVQPVGKSGTAHRQLNVGLGVSTSCKAARAATTASALA